MWLIVCPHVSVLGGSSRPTEVSRIQRFGAPGRRAYGQNMPINRKLRAGVDAGDDRLQGRPVERRVQPVEPLALLAPAPYDAVRQPELPEVTPRHRLAPTPFPALNQKLGGRAKVSLSRSRATAQ